MNKQNNYMCIKFICVLLCFLAVSAKSIPVNYHEKSIVVVITSFNNKEWYKKNLDSVFDQKYQNFRIIYLDDCSPDGTAQLVKQYTHMRGQAHRLTLIENKKWRSQMANHYYAVQLCNDEDIVVHVDGDDWLIDDYALQKINKVYSQEDIWCTYGQFKFWPSGDIGFAAQLPAEILAQAGYRQAPWVFVHLRTFYAWLFKKIKLQDLLFNGDFKAATPAPDSLFMYPLVEMAGPHARCITDVLYIYNLKNPLSQFVGNSNKQQAISDTVRSWPKYSPLKHSRAGFMHAYKNKTADCVIITKDRPGQLKKLLKSSIYFRGVRNIYVICEAKNNTILAQYKKLARDFLQSTFIFYDKRRDFFKSLFEHVLLYKVGDYVLLATDNCIAIDTLDLNQCIKLLEKTQAEGFYLGLSENNSDQGLGVHVDLFEKESAWQFKYAQGIWKEAYSLHCVLYRKKDIYQRVILHKYYSKEELEHRLHTINSDQAIIERKVGLFYKAPKLRNQV